MPFCPNCGTQIEGETRFCEQCGAQLYNQPTDGLVIRQPVYGNSMTSQLAMQQKVRTESIDELDRMISYFGKKQKEYDEYDKYNEMVALYSNPKTYIQPDAVRGTAFKVFGIIFLAGSVPISMVSCSMISEASSDYQIDYFYVSLFLCIVLGIALLSIGCGMNGRFVRRQRQKRLELIAESQRKLDIIAQGLMDYYRGYGYCMVSSLYTNPKILATIKGIITSGRADTIKEAINLMIQDAHYSEMELQATMTAQSAASAARGAKTAAFFSAAQFVSNLRR